MFGREVGRMQARFCIVVQAGLGGGIQCMTELELELVRLHIFGG